MIVSTCSFGSSGSSAVADYLAECDDAFVFDRFEFNFLTEPDGIEDLEYHLMLRPSRTSSSIYAIQRFNKLVQKHTKGWANLTKISEARIRELTDEYIDGLTQVRYKSFSPKIDKKHSAFLEYYLGKAIIRQRLVYGLEKKGIIKENFDFYPLDYVNLSVKPAGFYDLTKKYLRTLLEEMGFDFSKKVVLLDQAFSGNDPAKSFRFFDDPRAVVVDRDPRDMYIFAKKVLLSKGRFMPTDTVENFIAYYRALRDGQPYKEPNPQILRLQFEELVYNYEESVGKIDSFLGIENANRKKYFIPEMSAANTNLIRKYPEFAEDVEKIKAELSEYIFDFDQYDAIDSSNQSFFGRSLNRKKK